MTRLSSVVLACALFLASVVTSEAGSPHFVSAVFSTSGNVATVVAKEAGLGNETQIVAVFSGDAQCVNPGGNDPQAGNKQSFSTSSVVPVQNGKANYTLRLTAVLQPACTPPMTIRWSNLKVVDTTNGISAP